MKLVIEALQHEAVHAISLGAAGIVTISVFGAGFLVGA
jgi:hypothetical protein